MTWSAAGVLQRGLSVGTATQVSGRALFAFLALLVGAALSARGGVARLFGSMGRAELAVAACIAVASGMFIAALNYTTVANVLFLQALAPIVAALIAWIGFRERVTRWTAAAMIVAVAGVALMVGGPGGTADLGVVFAIVMTLTFASSVVIARHSRHLSMARAICLSQLLVVVAAGPFADPGEVRTTDLVLLVALGAGQMGIGLTFLTMGARLLPAAEAALISLLVVVLGPLWVWLAFAERPSVATLIGGAVVVVAVLLQAGIAARALAAA